MEDNVAFLCQQMLEVSQKTAEDLRKQISEEIRQCRRCATLLADFTDVSDMPHLGYLMDCFNSETHWELLFSVTPSVRVDSTVNFSLIETLFYEETVQVYTYVILSVTFTLESFYFLFQLKQSLHNHT